MGGVRGMGGARGWVWPVVGGAEGGEWEVASGGWG